MDKFIETVTAKIKADIEVDCKKHLEQRFSEEFCVYVNDAVKRVQDSYEEKWVDICDKLAETNSGIGLTYHTGMSGVFIVKILHYCNGSAVSFAIDNYGNSYNYSRNSLKQLDFEKLQMENPDNYVYPLPKWCLDLVSTFNRVYYGEEETTKLTKYLKDIAREVFEEAIYYNNLYSENYALKTELQELKSKLELTAPTDDLLGLDD